MVFDWNVCRSVVYILDECKWKCDEVATARDDQANGISHGISSKTHEKKKTYLNFNIFVSFNSMLNNDSMQYAAIWYIAFWAAVETETAAIEAKSDLIQSTLTQNEPTEYATATSWL